MPGLRLFVPLKLEEFAVPEFDVLLGTDDVGHYSQNPRVPAVDRPFFSARARRRFFSWRRHGRNDVLLEEHLRSWWWSPSDWNLRRF